MKKGCQKRIPTPGYQQWRHIFGAYNWATDDVITLISKKRNSEAFIAFLDHLVAQHDGKRPLVIVLDNGSIHRSYATQAAFAVLENDLLPLFLPRYCSQLNPIERFWKHLKSVACANKLFSDMDALVAVVEQVLLAQNDRQSDSRFMFLKNFA
jgi:transposase-like protein